MAIIKCKMCGGDLNVLEDATVCECEYCGTKQTVPKVDDEKKLTLFARAGRLLRACEFDKAAGVFETIVADFPDEAEAYWGLVLCKYGIEYVDDPATGKKIPTCHRSSFDSVLDDSNFEQACENTDAVARRVYRDEARAIEDLRQAILQVSGKEEPYDVFISYKETDGNGERTLDSVIAQDIYKELTGEAYRVFFSRISLEDKLGTEYEPYIFAALNSAKVMIVVGTDYENFDAVWVKNEWSRFLKLIAKGEKKTLIPVFKNMDAYDMPKEFAKLSAQDMGKVGAMQDLVRGVEKIVGKKKAEPSRETVVLSSANPNAAPLLERAFMFLEDGDWKSAADYCEKTLDLDPKNARAYVGKLMAELQVKRMENLAALDQPFDNNSNYQKALRFADVRFRDTLTGYIKTIKDRNECARLDKLYKEAVAKKNAATNEAGYKTAASLFEEITEWEDSAELAKECLEAAETARKNDVYSRAVNMMRSSSEQNIKQAAALFASIPGWKNADEFAKQCPDLAETARKNKLYDEAIEQGRKLRIDSLRSAIDKLRMLGDWKDAPDKIIEYEKRLENARKQLADAVAEREKQEKEARIRDLNYKNYLAEYPAAKEKQKYASELNQKKRKITELDSKIEEAESPIIGLLIFGIIFLVLAMICAANYHQDEFFATLLGTATGVVGTLLIVLSILPCIKPKLRRERKKIKQEAEKLKKIIDAIPAFEEYLEKRNATSSNPNEMHSEQSGRNSSAKSSVEKDPQIIDRITDAIKDFDRMDQLEYLSNALANDVITDEEYYMIIERIDG